MGAHSHKSVVVLILPSMLPGRRIPTTNLWNPTIYPTELAVHFELDMCVCLCTHIREEEAVCEMGSTYIYCLTPGQQSGLPGQRFENNAATHIESAIGATLTQSWAGRPWSAIGRYSILLINSIYHLLACALGPY